MAICGASLPECQALTRSHCGNYLQLVDAAYDFHCLSDKIIFMNKSVTDFKNNVWMKSNKKLLQPYNDTAFVAPLQFGRILNKNGNASPP